jgi:hypothetical protein
MNETPVMHKERIVKDDGRYLIFYYFGDEPAPEVQPSTPAHQPASPDKEKA